MEPDEEDLIEAWAFEPGWSGYSEEKAQEARRSMEKIKQEAVNAHYESIDSPAPDSNVRNLRARTEDAIRIGLAGGGGISHAAQAVIDEFELTTETQSLRWMDPNGPYPQTRVVGKWEDD